MAINSKKIEISVIVPFLNEERYIEKCVKSLISQNFPKREYELIFVDNGSKDASCSIVEKYLPTNILRELKRGPYYARNKGLAAAKGEIVAFTDADCLVDKNWLRAIKAAMKRKDALGVLGKRLFLDKKTLKMFELFENLKTEYVSQNLSKEYQFGFTNNIAFRTSELRQVGGFTNRIPISADVEIVQRMLNSFPKKKFIYSSKMKIVHLEVSDFIVWLKKYFDYGTNHDLLTKTGKFMTLSAYQNYKIFLLCLQKKKFGYIERSLFLLLLVLKSLAYQLGALYK